MKISPCEYDYLIRAVEADKFPIMLAGDWLDKRGCMKLLAQHEFEHITTQDSITLHGGRQPNDNSSIHDNS